mmetsp:Transcript_11884/g.28155  ORF Transcript_11884/g.28155 Transcript_11884/m.28155 type:complete len:183 (+) Transcript_11884:118-666(+)
MLRRSAFFLIGVVAVALLDGVQSQDMAMKRFKINDGFLSEKRAKAKLTKKVTKKLTKTAQVVSKYLDDSAQLRAQIVEPPLKRIEGATLGVKKKIEGVRETNKMLKIYDTHSKKASNKSKNPPESQGSATMKSASAPKHSATKAPGTTKAPRATRAPGATKAPRRARARARRTRDRYRRQLQ